MLQQLITTEHRTLQGSRRTVLQKWTDQTGDASDHIKGEISPDVVRQQS